MVLRKFQHGAICLPGQFTPSLLPRLPRPTPNGRYLFHLTLPDLRTPGTDLHPMLVPPLYHGGVPMVVRDHARRGKAQLRPGAGPYVPAHETDDPSLRPQRNGALTCLNVFPYSSMLCTARCNGLTTIPPQPPSPPPQHKTHGGAPSRLKARHTPPNSAPPPYYPPSPLLDKVARKPPKRPRPPSPAAHTMAPKHARQPPKPIRRLSLVRTTASQPQLEPPPPERPLTIRDMFNPAQPSTERPSCYLRPRPHSFSPHNEVLRTSPPLPCEH